MVIRALKAADADAVYEGFLEAFSDYVVPMKPPQERFVEMLRRRGYEPEASVAAFDEERIVAFTLNGVEGDAAYDSGTGVVPSHRRRGLAREMMERSARLLRGRGCSTYVLEVIDSNRAAIELYRRLGFVETRGLQCWTLDAPAAAESAATVFPDAWTSWWDITPSWQNSTASLARAADERVVVGGDDGVAVVLPLTGEVPQLAVRRDARRRGIGSNLLRQALATAGQPLRILNVDDQAGDVATFLERAGARRTVRQLEMLQRL